MIDKEISVPAHLLDHLSSNPKGEIHGIYRAGLRASLAYFDVCDRLKVWPNPKAKGRYIIINGNQRLSLIIEKKKHDLICEHFNLNANDEYSDNPAVVKEFKSRLRAINADPDNEKLLQNFQVKASQTNVDVQVLERLDEEDAKLFAATFDRNRAKTDEAKLVNLVSDEIRSKNQALISKMVRPERAFVQPLPRPDTPFTPQVSPAAQEPYTPPQKSNETNSPAPPLSSKWGDPPPIENNSPPPPSLVPLTLSLTRDGYQEVMSSILRVNSRIFRENTLKSALNQLSEALGDSPLDTDSIICEIALLTINKHIEVASSKKS